MKMIDRRKFLLTGVASLVATTVPPFSFANSFLQFIESTKDKKMLSYFEDRLNQQFVANNDDHSFDIKLTEVRPYAHSDKLEQFELIFKANNHKDQSGLYQVSRTGTLETQLIRLEQRGDKQNYSAIFNLLT